MRSGNLVGNMLNQQCGVVTARGRYSSKVNMCFYIQVNDLFLLMKNKELQITQVSPR